MTVFLEVLNDLFRFVIGRDQAMGDTQTNQSELEGPKLLSPGTLNQNTKEEKDERIYQHQQTSSSLSLVDYAQKQYVINSSARVWQHPYISFDGVTRTLPFASMVLSGQQKGRFVQVDDDGHEGWMMAEDLTDDKDKITPSLENDQVYVSNSTQTKLIRQFINDEFSGDEMLLPLQPEEFVIFKLRQIGKGITWGESRPRLAGNWQNLLKGCHGISIGVTPKTGSIMEWNKEGKGYLGYVKQVTPEENISVSGVGFFEEGMYTTLSLKREEWIEYRPVFISIA